MDLHVFTCSFNVPIIRGHGCQCGVNSGVLEVAGPTRDFSFQLELEKVTPHDQRKAWS